MRLFTLLIACFFMVTSCQPKKENTTEAVAEEEIWKGMDEFHMIMAETFHPYRDSANIQPAKDYAAELDSLARQWSSESLPAKVNTDEVKGLLKSLTTETARLDSMATTASNDEIGSVLTSVHDIFHQLQEAWYAEAGTGEHE